MSDPLAEGGPIGAQDVIGGAVLAGQGAAEPEPAAVELLACPACQGGRVIAAGARLMCTRCGHFMASADGVLDLRLDSTQDSALDLDSYDAAHLVDPAQAHLLYEVYDRAISTYQTAPRAAVLEIGAGTGNLTHGLYQSGQFRDIHCSDISQRFMVRLRSKLVEQSNSTRLHCYLFDANYFPFRDNSFGTVVGHSILHHLAAFEATLRDAHRVLLPGGVAIFGEPVMEYHALGCLAADLVRRANAMHPDRPLSERAQRALGIIAGRGAVKMRNLLERDESVAQYEDKFIFPTDYMRDLARRIGFAEYRLMNRAPVHKLGALLDRRLRLQLDAAGASGRELDAFRPLFDAFTQSYETSLGPFVAPPFAYNVFVK